MPPTAETNGSHATGEVVAPACPKCGNPFRSPRYRRCWECSPAHFTTHPEDRGTGRARAENADDPEALKRQGYRKSSYARTRYGSDLAAMYAIGKALGALTPDDRLAVIAWINAKYAGPIT